MENQCSLAPKSVRRVVKKKYGVCRPLLLSLSQTGSFILSKWSSLNNNNDNDDNNDKSLNKRISCCNDCCTMGNTMIPLSSKNFSILSCWILQLYPSVFFFFSFCQSFVLVKGKGLWNETVWVCNLALPLSNCGLGWVTRHLGPSVSPSRHDGNMPTS